MELEPWARPRCARCRSEAVVADPIKELEKGVGRIGFDKATEPLPFMLPYKQYLEGGC